MNHENLQDIRHTLAHLLAASVRELYPGTKNAIGPAIENGFYQDFDFSSSPLPKGEGQGEGIKISDADLPKIEAKMREKLKTWGKFERREVTPEEAKQEFSWNEYKLELIEEFAPSSPLPKGEGQGEGKPLTFYTIGGFIDLCKGGHVDDASKIDPDSFKLHKVAGAYWRGDEKNKMLTRIYGLAFESKEKLDEYLKMMEEAAKRDHKKLGKELGLFVFSEIVGKGLPLLTAKGAAIRRELERFTIDEELKRGYLHVITPDIAKVDLYKKSGHYPYYKDSMYAPIKIDDDEFMLRPMTCPHHFEIYLAEPHSYKELPMRYAELAHLYRYEQSGELMGLIRLRTFTLADAHIIARKSQAKEEIIGVLDLIDYMCEKFGLKLGEDYKYRLSLGDRSDNSKYYKDDEAWEFAENTLRNVLTERKAEYVEANDEAAFYGPKIDVQMKNVNGKEDTAFTVQYDFVMPKRFNLKYTNEDGQEEEPMVVHRSSIGCIERVMAFLIEKYAGAFPLWLSPVQVAVLPISDKQMDYAEKIVNELRVNGLTGLRVETDSRSESIGKKIREAEQQKTPYMLIIGGKEQEAGTVSVRQRGEKDLGSMSVEEFGDKLREEISSKA